MSKFFYFISTSFWFVRQFLICNPFEVLGEGIPVIISGVSITLCPDILNLIAGLILPLISFFTCGLYYESGSWPSLGSFLYMFFFLTHTGILYLMSLAYPMYWIIALILIAYISMHILFRYASNKWTLYN